MIKIEAVVRRDRVETVVGAVEAETGHVGVTVVDAIGHGRQRGVSHEYHGRTYESHFLPKALLIFIVPKNKAEKVVEVVADASRTGEEIGDGVVWTTEIHSVIHSRTDKPLHEYAK